MFLVRKDLLIFQEDKKQMSMVKPNFSEIRTRDSSYYLQTVKQRAVTSNREQQLSELSLSHVISSNT